MMLCDVKTKYVIDGAPYLGKDTNTSLVCLWGLFSLKTSPKPSMVPGEMSPWIIGLLHYLWPKT